MTKENRERQVIREFGRRRARQLAAVVAVIFLMISLLWKMGHPGVLLGELSRSTVTALEVILIAGFVLFSSLNWRCPACGRYLGADINPRGCRKCGARLR